jgi:putative glycosyltransferase (TIGR04372 family)
LPSFINPVPLARTSEFFVRRLWLFSFAKTDTYQYATAIRTSAALYTINRAWESERKNPAMSCKMSWLDDKSRVLEKWGIKPGVPYVCIHARDANYSPDDERWHHHRNVEIESFANAIEFLNKEGVSVIRMGDPTMPKAYDLGLRVFDYSHCPDRAPWLDLAISAECLFFLGTSSGAVLMASIFGRPVACVGMALPFNWSPTGFSQDIGIPKLFRSKETGELLGFPKLFKTGISELRFAEDINRYGFELVENTPEEITEVAQEMYERLSGTWVDKPEDLVLQERLHAFLHSGSYSYGSLSKCGAHFLRRYRYLLDLEFSPS